MGQIRAQPVKDRHEIVHDNLYPVFCKIADGDIIILDVLVAAGQAHLNILMDIYALDHLALQARFMHLVNVSFDLLFCPHFACRLVIQEPHQAGHARNLPDLAQLHGITVLPKPAECHFHCVFLLILYNQSLPPKAISFIDIRLISPRPESSRRFRLSGTEQTLPESARQNWKSGTEPAP